MAELLCSRYIPVETLIVKREGKDFDNYLKRGYEVKEHPNNLYEITKPPKLEMVFRERENDFVFNMIDDACHYYKVNAISSLTALTFALAIANGEIKVSIFQDGSYTLNKV